MRRHTFLMMPPRSPASETSAPEISVIVPVHDVQDHVSGCIASLIAQTFHDFDVIVVDDGSTDASPARLRDAIGDDPRFRVIRQDNRGLSGARNTGLDAAQGAFIAFLDGDDRYDPDFLQRMHTALADSDADWIACGLRNIHPDGHITSHSAIHATPDLPETDSDFKGAPRLWPLNDWRDVTGHFPSAWNKLYRRSLLEGLRFDAGTWFEDHAFFCRVAARTDTLLHLPAPLYLQTRGRPGQITTTESDRVFEQIGVLDTLAGILCDPPKPGGRAALGQLAHRLFHERSAMLRDPGRRARFIAAARDWLARHDLPATPDSALPPSWALEFTGTCPLSVVVPWDGQEGPLRVTLAALARQIQGGTELLIVADDATTAARGVALAAASGLAGARGLGTPPPGGAGAARNTGLQSARGEMIVFADAGDQLNPAALAHWTDTMLRENADFGFSQFRVGLDSGAVHPGFHDSALFTPLPDTTGPLPLSPDQVLALHCHPTAKIFRRAMLIRHDLRFGTGPLGAWQISIGAALAAQKRLYFAWPGAESSEAPEARRLWNAPVSASALVQALDDAAACWPPALCRVLPPDWQRRLYARALWEVASFAPMPAAAYSRFRFEAIRIVRQRGWHRMTGPFDPHVTPPIRALMNGSTACPVASPRTRGQ